MRLFALCVFLSGLAACASATRVRGPDGSMNWYAIDCAYSRSYCAEKAGDMCPRGYEVADQSDQHGWRVQSNENGVSGGSTYNGTMLVRCREGRGEEP